MNNRFFSGLVFIFLGFFIIIVRFFYIQVIKGDYFYSLANQQVLQEEKISSQRGIIYDRFEKELATNIETYSVYANPKLITQPLQYAKILSSILSVSSDEIYQKLKKDSYFVWLDRKIMPEKKNQIVDKKMTGIYFLKEYKRFYPENELASSILGMVGMDNQGLAGIEYFYEQQLKGKEEKIICVRDMRGETIFLDNIPSLNNKGNDVYLNIDKNLQAILETELENVYHKHSMKTAMGIIQNPANGEILALGNYPSFNPNNLEEIKKFSNPCISNIYEPGSTFKIFTAIACLKEGIGIDEKVYCENGFYKLGNYPIRDHEKHGLLNFKEVIQYSSNIGVAKLASKIPPRKLYSCWRDFGFGNYTGVEYPYEPAGILRPPQEWSNISCGRMSFGQEVGVTPLQLINAVSAVANGGTLYEPHLVKKIVNCKGEVVKLTQPVVIRNLNFSDEIKETINEMLIAVVEEGTGQKAKVSGYKVAGKTGTAQKINPQTNSYYPDIYISSFVGFLPADDPKLVILIVLDEIKGFYWASETAAPVFSSVASKAMHYLNISSEDWEICSNIKKEK